MTEEQTDGTKRAQEVCVTKLAQVACHSACAYASREKIQGTCPWLWGSHSRQKQLQPPPWSQRGNPPKPRPCPRSHNKGMSWAVSIRKCSPCCCYMLSRQLQIKAPFLSPQEGYNPKPPLKAKRSLGILGSQTGEGEEWMVIKLSPRISCTFRTSVPWADHLYHRTCLMLHPDLLSLY